MRQEIENKLGLIRNLSNNRISEIESYLGNGDMEKGRKVMVSLLKALIEENFLSQEIGKMTNRDRHTIHNWYKRYRIKPIEYLGFKKSIIILTTDEKEHEINHTRYEDVNNEKYRTYYVYPTKGFAYLVGLLLGDGHADKRKVYLVGGRPYKFLDKIYPIIKELTEYLGERSTKIIYYTKDDIEVDRRNSEVSYWRIYIYWSALSNFFRNKKLLKNSLQIIWSNEKLFNFFTAGLFDTDGYFTEKYGKPERIELEQSNKRWWFPLYCEELKRRYDTTFSERKRKYKIIKKGKLYQGVSESSIIGLKKSSWPAFMDNIIKPCSNKVWYENKGELFKAHALKNQKRWHKWRKS